LIVHVAKTVGVFTVHPKPAPQLPLTPLICKTPPFDIPDVESDEPAV